MFHDMHSGRRSFGVALAILLCAGAVVHQGSSAAHASPSVRSDTLLLRSGAASDDGDLARDSAAQAGESTDAFGEKTESAYSADEMAAIAFFDRLESRGARGISGRIMATTMQGTQLAVASDLPIRVPEPGVTTMVDPRNGREHSLLTLVPFSNKAGKAVLDGYRLGYWPGERRSVRTGAYALPEGFIRVTLENRDTRVSENFRLRDFLTKDQADVWPKYLVLSMDLVDKLELMIDELNEMGYDARHLHVMSGFRTPQYNAGGSGRASNSRHQYGDAADVYVDNDRDGQLDDLDGNGRVNLGDARIIVQAAERVERKYPSLVGGIGGYSATSAHPPFVHVDTRGVRARWGAL